LDKTHDEKSVRIREFKIRDYPTVRSLWEIAGLELRPGDELQDIRLKLQRDPDLFLVAVLDRKIVGSIIGGWDGRRGWIYHLAVKPDQQRKGIGVGLVREVEKRLVAKGAPIVNAQIHRQNEKSAKFFEAVGYETRSHLMMIGKQLRK
jgi:ribosomal protein S18 acetylase RimI-like enzyme